MSEDPVKLSEIRKHKRAKAAARSAIAGAAVADPEAAEAADARAAARFEMRAEGLFRTLPGKWPEFVCGHIEIVGETRERAMDTWGLLLRFRDRNQQLIEYVARRHDFTADGTELARRLAARGLTIRSDRTASSALTSYLWSIQSPGRAFVVDSTGWHDDLPGEKEVLFVLPSGALGDPGAQVIHRSRLGGEAPVPFSTAGTMEGWQRGVAAAALGNSRLTLSISSAFASPLLYLTEDDGGIVHLRGEAKSGKTTCLRAAASAWGAPGGRSRGTSIRSWRTTPTALEEIAALQSDTFLALDEMGNAEGREIGDMVYFLANGQGRARGARSGGLRETSYFRILALSSGEIALADKMAEAGKIFRAGQELRLLDLDAVVHPETGAFETLHGAPSVAAFAAGIAGAAAEHHGHAGPAMIAFVLRKLREDPHYGHGLAREAADLGASWLQGVKDAGEQTANAARRFALVGIAGAVATDAGITGWPEGAATEAAHTCFLAWLTGRGFAGSREDEEARRRLRDFCQLHGKSRFEEWAEPRGAQADAERPEDLPGDRVPVVNRAGFRRFETNDGGGKEWRYYLTSTGVGDVFRGLDVRAALRSLARRGYVGRDAAGAAGKTRRPPGHNAQRLYEVLPKLFSDDTE